MRSKISDIKISIDKDLKLKNYEKSQDINSVPFEDALSSLGFGKIQLIVLLLCGLILMTVINETMGMMFIMPASQCDLNLTSADKGILSSVSYLGIMISSHLWGYLADTKGRRNVIIYTTFASNIMTVISSFMGNIWSFAILRLLSGFCISGSSATLYAYLGEFIGSKFRATVITFGCCFVGLASIYIPSMAYLLLEHDWTIQITETLTYRPWRLLVIVYCLPGFFASLFLLSLKESPKFLMSIGCEDKALDVLNWMHKFNNGKESEFGVKKLTREANESHLENLQIKGVASVLKSVWNQTIPLLKPPYVLYFFVQCTLMFSVFMASSGMGMWFVELLNVLIADNAPSESICGIIDMLNQNNTSNLNVTVENLSEVCVDKMNLQAYSQAIYLGCAYTCGYILIGLTIRKFGRVTLLFGLLTLSGISGISLHFITIPQLEVLLLAFYIMFSGLCISIVTATNVDLFPTHLRAMAVCIALMMGRFGSIAGTNFVGLLLVQNCTVTFIIFPVTILVCAGLSLIIPCK